MRNDLRLGGGGFNFNFDVGCWMLGVGCWMLDVGCWMLIIYHVSFLLSFLFNLGRDI